ncbi:MAG: hypothetical protein OM95_14230 [Bdellovibrio sp. ArHS]|uniref:hypothetical protein n=1 Tax=Bdellovibrio sp. ArHS TaxID=1569284 RepID=UPI0005826FFE|nr:hypothetical protein [Bdellovibrio sp. ArHS]KHD87448.1 MAG: hypothetical protein OM95_14230 [Bdellovibrio sp. ArHS]
MRILLFILLFPVGVLAQPTTTGAELDVQTESAPRLGFLDESPLHRQNSDYFVLGTYAPFDLLIPSKWGLTAGINQGPDTSWELEFLQGSLALPFYVDDLGKMTERRISLVRRSYGSRNSFYWSYGLTYFSFNAQLGNEFVNAISGSYPDAEVVGLEAWGFNLGLGNRWTIRKNFTIGVEWFSWAQPVHVSKRDDDYLNYATNNKYKDEVDTTLNIASYFPRFTVCKVQLGWMF